MYMLMDNRLDMGNIFSRKTRFGFGFGFSVMGGLDLAPDFAP